MSNKKYTAEELEFIRDNVSGRTFAELTEMFNKRFGTCYSQSSVMSTAYRYGYRNGRDSKFNKGYEPTQFKKGMEPWNKGKRYKCPGSAATQFKSGNMPHNYKPVGTKRITRDGYVEIKIADPKKWRSKHRLIWEAANGPMPKGHVVIFADGNKRNFELNNLILVSRKQLAILNKYRLIQDDADLTKTGIKIADLVLKIGERNRT